MLGESRGPPAGFEPEPRIDTLARAERGQGTSLRCDSRWGLMGPQIIAAERAQRGAHEETVEARLVNIRGGTVHATCGCKAEAAIAMEQACRSEVRATRVRP